MTPIPLTDEEMQRLRDGVVTTMALSPEEFDALVRYIEHLKAITRKHGFEIRVNAAGKWLVRSSPDPRDRREFIFDEIDQIVEVRIRRKRGAETQRGSAGHPR